MAATGSKSDSPGLLDGPTPTTAMSIRSKAGIFCLMCGTRECGLQLPCCLEKNFTPYKSWVPPHLPFASEGTRATESRFEESNCGPHKWSAESQCELGGFLERETERRCALFPGPRDL